jgi:Cu+-exporting ATPase
MDIEKETEVKELLSCYHCGNDCDNSPVPFDNKVFCCQGCSLVYDILKENNLCTYYNFNNSPGTSQNKSRYKEQFAYLDDEKIKNKLVRFTDGKITSITFYLPQIHCSSCIWLLENLNRINPAIIKSLVNFNRKEATLTYIEEKVTLRQLVEMLSMIGYEPSISLNDSEEKKNFGDKRTTAYKIGIAGFCFGNIMLFSFPEYFSSGSYTGDGFKGVFSYLNFALSLPVFFYCSSQFFVSAANSLKQKFLNIDVPIALGILVMFLRSSYEIISGTGAGYMDTMAGLVFFMLLGRAFQNKTYETISFERDYKSFFPISVMLKKNNTETSIPVSDLEIGNRIIIRNEELIPADSVLIKGDATIDYSFVTGESMPVLIREGQLIYAGGKQRGTSLELEVVKNVSQSYLTQLWNSSEYKNKNEESRFRQLVNSISHYFTIALIAIALASLGWWVSQNDLAKGLNAFTAVLIIACPCALAISSPFTLGNILRSFGRNKFYLKNYSVIEKLAKVDSIVFDKTGTLTKTNASQISFTGEILSPDENKMVRSLVHQSSHPLSRMLDEKLKDVSIIKPESYHEIPGKGIQAIVFNVPIKIGSAEFVGAKTNPDISSVKIYVSFDSKIRGYFCINNEYRKGIEFLVDNLKKSGYTLTVLSGDHDGEKNNLEKIFGKEVNTHFNQTPTDKLRFIQTLQAQNKNVLMIGDGLNDAGALKQSDVGITISDNINNFSPACDGILNASCFDSLTGILKISKASHRIILGSFAIALLYNVIGLFYAVSGTLSPIVAAILMPISAVTIISFTTGLSNWYARRKL